MGEPTSITAQTPLSAGQRIRHKDTGYEWDLGQTVSVFKAEYDAHPGWLLVSPLGRASVVVYPEVLTGGSWLLVGSGSPATEEGPRPMGEQPVHTTTTAPPGTTYGWPKTPVGSSPTMVGVALQQAMDGAALCALGHHAWVPWLTLPSGSYVTWCARGGCDHHEQWDGSGSPAETGEDDTP